jgi:hypothetical protein
MVKRRIQDAGFRLRPGDQIATRLVTIQEIMSQPQFVLGVSDARAGRRYRADYDLWTTNGQWNYERGRQWAMLAPRYVPLKNSDGKINVTALRYYRSEII